MSEPSLSRRRHAPKGHIKAPDPMDAPDLMDRRCTATSKQNKRRCKRDAIPGGTVCYIHGGNAPQVKEAAEERLRKLQHPAIDRLAKLIDQDQFPSVAYAASRDVLDRTLGKPTESLEIKNIPASEALSDDELKARLSDLVRRL